MLKITFSGTNTPGSLVLVSTHPGIAGSKVNLQVYYRTSDSDTPITIASAVEARIKGMASQGLNATAVGPEVSVTSSSSVATIQCLIFDPPAPNTWADVQLKVVASDIFVTGRASNRCAAYVSFNLGGPHPTYGVFVRIPSGASASTVATSIASAIVARNLQGAANEQGVNIPLGVTAIVMDPPVPGQSARVSLTGVQEIQCEVSSDVFVGQPTNTYCSKCSNCCGNQIGVVIDARQDLDVALIQLNPAWVDKYRAEIMDIGVVRGDHNITKEASGYPLKTRGAVTAKEKRGTLMALNIDGVATASDENNKTPTWTVFRRYYTGAFLIKGTDIEFSIGGDSGAAVLNSNSEVVGILFSGDRTKNVAWATPIRPIMSAFPALPLAIETATTPDQNLGVPSLTAQEAAELEFQNVSANAGELPGPVLQQLQQVEREIAATPAGRCYSALVQRHFPEVQALIDTNRRVATVWQRNSGPRIARGVMRMAQSPDEPLPAEIDGKPLSECLAGIQRVFTRYGSPDLAADLNEYGPPLAQLAGLTYSQVLDALRSMRAD
jgi:hypothetical protein